MYQSTFSMAASSSFGMGAKELGFLQVLIFFLAGTEVQLLTQKAASSSFG